MEKKYPIGGYAPGNYRCTCCKCGTEFSGDKRAVECEPCAVKAKEAFDALSPEQQQATLERNVIIANWMFETPLTPERDLILRIVSQWGNAIEMPNMDQWLKDYAAKAQPAPRWVKASEFKTHKPVYRPYRKPAMEDEGEYDYGEIYVTEDDSRIYLDVDNECNYEHQSDERWKDYEILDEQPAAGREGGAVLGILQYISESEFYYNHAEKAWLIKGTHSIKLTHNELIEKYELFKQHTP